MASPIIQFRVTLDLYEQALGLCGEESVANWAKQLFIDALIASAAEPLVVDRSQDVTLVADLKEPTHQPGAAGRSVAGGSKDYKPYEPPKRIACKCGGYKDHRGRCNRCNQTKFFNG